MNLDEAIGKKNVELEEMQKDIDSLESQALPLKETVKKMMKIVLGFINTIDDSYIKNKYPLLESILINKPDAPAASAIN
ncbi:MAG: hypothetical protein M5U17_01785 [Ignavibacterium sp.]|nr:hypothetical protein [Ignavibacterium sp.]